MGRSIAVSIRRYNKLVRDRIPEIIAADQLEVITRILSEDEYQRELRVKLVEEAGEVDSAMTADELTIERADVVELVHAIAGANDVNATVKADHSIS